MVQRQTVVSRGPRWRAGLHLLLPVGVLGAAVTSLQMDSDALEAVVVLLILMWAGFVLWDWRSSSERVRLVARGAVVSAPARSYPDRVQRFLEALHGLSPEQWHEVVQHVVARPRDLEIGMRQLAQTWGKVAAQVREDEREQLARMQTDVQQDVKALARAGVVPEDLTVWVTVAGTALVLRKWIDRGILDIALAPFIRVVPSTVLE